VAKLAPTKDEETPMKTLLAAAALCLLPLAAHAQTTPITVWKGGAPVAGAPPANFGSHTMSQSRRDKDGLAELHKVMTDVMVIQKGAAVLHTGGEVVEPTETAPNEVRGPSIKGGVRTPVAPGDIINIPAGTPHQFLVPAGGEVVYVFVKIPTK